MCGGTALACLPSALSMSPPWGFAGGSTGKEPARQRGRCKRRVWSLSLEDPPEEGTATHSSILAWGIRGVRWATVLGVAKSWTRLKWLSRHARMSAPSAAAHTDHMGHQETFLSVAWEQEHPSSAHSSQGLSISGNICSLDRKISWPSWKGGRKMFCTRVEWE